MFKKYLFILLIVTLTWASALFLSVLAYAQKQAHKAYHGGVLNVIGKELGHVEIIVQDGIMEAWFVGGGHDTDRAVPIAAAEIPLTIILPGKKQEKLVLKAAPMKLAGEKLGHCSHFIAAADWLKSVKEFEAFGEVVFKGARQKLIIKYPEGYDPIHRKK